MKSKTKEKLKKIYKALATTDEKTVFTLKTLEKNINKLKEDLQEAKKADPRTDSIIDIVNELATRETPTFDTKDLENKISVLEENFNRAITSIQENLVEKAPDYKKEIESLTNEIETLRRDILVKFANLGGGSANQKVSVNGTWATKRYADLNIVFPGALVTNDDVTKETKINFSFSAVSIVTTTYTILSTDEVIVCNSTTPFTVTLPAATGSGQTYAVKNINTGIITLEGNSSDKIDGELNQTINQWEDIQLTDYAANAWIII